MTNHRIQCRTSSVPRVAKLEITLTKREPPFCPDSDPAANAMQLAIARARIQRWNVGARWMDVAVANEDPHLVYYQYVIMIYCGCARSLTR